MKQPQILTETNILGEHITHIASQRGKVHKTLTMTTVVNRKEYVTFFTITTKYSELNFNNWEDAMNRYNSIT